MDAKEVIRRVGAVEAGSEIKEVPEKKKKFFGLDIGALIGAMIAIVVGVNLIPSLIDATKEVEEEGEVLVGLIGVLPWVFAAVVIIGAAAYIYFGGRKEKYEEVEELSGTDEIRALQKKKRRHLIYTG